MAATAELFQYMTDINMPVAAAGNQVDFMLHPDQSKKYGYFFHVPQTMNDQGNLGDIRLTAGFRNHNSLSVNNDFPGRQQQIIQQ